VARTGRPPKWSKEQLEQLKRDALLEPIYYVAKRLGMKENTARWYCKKFGIPIIPRRQNWSEEDTARLVDMVVDHTVAEIAKELVRSDAGVRVKAHKLGLSVNQATRRAWEPMEDNFLYGACERMSLAEAGNHLNRSRMSVWHRVSHLGISWVQGRRSFREIALDLGCHTSYIRRLAKKAGVHLFVPKGGGMANVSQEHYDILLACWFGPIRKAA